MKDLAAKIKALRDAGGSIRAASRISQFSYGALQAARKEADQRGIVFEPLPPIVERKQAQIQQLERRIRELEQANLSFDEIRSTIMGLAVEPVAPPNWLVEPKKGSTGSGAPTLCLNDWHAGEVVNAAEVNYVNEFSTEILQRRVKAVITNAVDIAYNHMTQPEYPGIVVPTLGDMVTGEIHDELAKTNDMELLPLIPVVVDMLVWAYQRLADKFGSVYAPCCSGNHGRTTRRIEMKHFTAKNFDWLIYTLVERALKDDDRITIDNPSSNEPQWNVYGTRYLALHGHDLGVKGGDGIIGALGPIMRGSIKVGQQQAQVGREFDVLILGHWHQYLPLPRVIVSNTLKGYDEFAAKGLRASPSAPSQAMWWTHPKHGITCHWQVFAESTQRKGSEEWLT